METELISILFNVFLLIGVLIAFKSRQQISALLHQIGLLQKTVELQSRQIEELKRHIKSQPYEPVNDMAKPVVSTPQRAVTVNPPPKVSAKPTAPVASPTSSAKSAKQPPRTVSTFDFEAWLRGNGIFWLGAAVLAIGGIFLAKYSIEAGLMPPSVRVILGALFGCALVAAAELANHFKTRLRINTPYISAALASGGVITCFAMALVAFDFYQFISANVAFGVLAIISLASTYLALRFGPVLAGVGIIGAYAVPALVSTGSNNVFALLLYVAFVSLSAVWVAEYVKQRWVWWQGFAGHFIWFAIATVMASTSDVWILFVFTLVSLYLFVLSGVLGWALKGTMTAALSVKNLLMPRKEQAGVVLSLWLLYVFIMLSNPNDVLGWVNLLLAGVMLVAAFRHSALDTWPFLMLLFALLSYENMHDLASFEDGLFPFSGRYLFAQLVTLSGIAFSMFMLLRFADRPAYLLLLVLTPVSMLGVSYVTAPIEAETYLYPLWALYMALIGAGASIAAVKSHVPIRQVTYLILANSMLALCFTMLLSASTLTLAITMQVASMSYLSWKFKVRIPDWLYKAALLVVICRLTLSPWIAHYKHETILGIHWTLVVYPLALALIGFAIKYNPSTSMRAWLQGVILHIVALLLTTETSYLLTGDYPDFVNLSYAETILLSLNWLVLSAVYFWRSHLSGSLSGLYQKAGFALMALAILLQLDISLVHSPFITQQFVGEGWVNWLWLQWLMPAVVLAIVMKFKLLPKQYNNAILGVIAVLGFLFINGEIRALFNLGYLRLGPPMQQAELYTYSVVWLAISTLTIYLAQLRENSTLVKAGFIGLAVVLLKAFVVDMAHLEGLFRALSFIGLGLCLVGIGWLFQKMQKNEPEPV